MTGDGGEPAADPLGTWEPRPLPEVTPETERFWAAAAEGRFLLSACCGCGLVYHYPRARCPDCLSGDVAWREAAGTGTVYSYTVLPAREGWPESALPLVIVYVELDEGVRVVSSLAGSGRSVSVGERVAAAFVPTERDGVAIPVFRSAEGDAD